MKVIIRVSALFMHHSSELRSSVGALEELRLEMPRPWWVDDGSSKLSLATTSLLSDLATNATTAAVVDASVELLP